MSQLEYEAWSAVLMVDGELQGTDNGQRYVPAPEKVQRVRYGQVAVELECCGLTTARSDEMGGK